MSLRSRVKNAISALQGKQPSLPVYHQALGESGRDSLLDPYRRDIQFNRPIRPDETVKRAGRRLDYERMINMTVSQVVLELLDSSPEFRSIVNTYLDFCVQDYILDGEDDRAKEIIQAFIIRMGGKAKMMSFLRQVAYGYYVEGAVCMELVNDSVTRQPKSLEYVSPWNIAAQKMNGPNGEYYAYGQIDRGGALNPKLYDPEDPEVNDDYWKYVPADQKGHYPFGTSQIAANIFSATALTNLVTLIVQFIQGRVFPKHIWFPDYTKMPPNSKYDEDDFIKAGAIITKLLKGQIDASDITEDYLTSLPVVAMLVGSLERANIDGVELMADIFERQIQRGSRIPRTIFGSRRAGSGLNDTESRVEWGGWHIVTSSAMLTMSLPVSELFSVILETEGYNVPEDEEPPVQLRMINNDVEINRIYSEAFDLKADAFTKIKGLGLHTREYLFRKFNDNSIKSYDFSDAGETEFLEMEPEPVAPQPADPADPGAADE